MDLQQSFPKRLMDGAVDSELDWDAIYADQVGRIYAYFRYRLGNDADIEDLTSRTFEKAWLARGRYRRDLAGFSTWLFRIAQNVGTDYLRSHRAHLPIDAALDVIDDSAPDRDAELGSDRAHLLRLLDRLPERDRELIALKFGAAISNGRIAQLMGLSESNVSTVLHRTVQTLRAKW